MLFTRFRLSPLKRTTLFRKCHCVAPERFRTARQFWSYSGNHPARFPIRVCALNKSDGRAWFLFSCKLRRVSFLRWAGALVALASASCGGSNAIETKFARAPGEHIDVPDEAGVYSTDAGSEGVVGGQGSESLAADVAAELRKRGAAAGPDGGLAATATWLLREVNEGHPLADSTANAAAHRFGFAGVIVAMSGFSLDPEHRGTWRTGLDRVPRNLPVTRYGISVSPSGHTAAVVFGVVEISVEPFARHLAVNDSVELRGELSPRYAFAHVYLTKTDGSVEEKRTASRRVDASFSFTTPGKYELEVMGDGVTGPVIVLNVPLYVGISEEAVSTSSGHVTSPSDGEARMLELLNQSRKAAGLRALLADDELREVALGHSEDMAEHHFVGHVSPTTGTTEDRERRSGIVVVTYGENIAQAESAEQAHDGLMQSPGHRANMLSSQFTHVGIAAVSTDTHQLVFTLMFARRANPATMPRNAAQVEAAFLALRAKKGLSAPVSDAIYRAATSAGVDAFVAASKPTPAVAVGAENAALAREVQRTGSSRPAACSFVTELLELDQLEDETILQAPGLRRYGIAARLHKDEHGERLTIMMLLEGAPCQ
jgi:uncharacterized protein YkwD